MSLHIQICMLNVQTPEKCPHSPSFIPPIPTPSPPPSLDPQPMVPPAPAMSVQAFLKTACCFGQGEPQLNDDRANAEDWMLGLRCHISTHWIQGSPEWPTSSLCIIPRSCVQTSVVALNSVTQT